MRPQPTRRWPTVVAGTAALLLLAPLTAAANSHNFTNYRGVPNNACDFDTPPAAFTDREDAAEVHQRSIDCIAAHDVAEGYEDGTFGPHDPVTRGQMASFVARTLDAAGDRDLPDDPDDHFTDTGDSVHERRINQLAEVGIVEGRSADRYEPAAPVTRAQMASFVLRAAAWNHTGQVDAYAPAGEDPYFLDIDGTHAAAIRAGYELWLFEGRAAGEYDPGSDVHRAQMATFLTRLLDLIHPNAYQTNNQTYLMSPSEPVSTDAGEPLEFAVEASRANYVEGAEPIPGDVQQALHIALFPCDNVDTDLPATFADADRDGLADGIGTTDTGQAYIRDVNGEPVEGRETMVRTVSPEDGRITFTVISPASDCTVAVAFDDRGPADELRLDAGHRPANAFGFVVGSWD